MKPALAFLERMLYIIEHPSPYTPLFLLLTPKLGNMAKSINLHAPALKQFPVQCQEIVLSELRKDLNQLKFQPDHVVLHFVWNPIAPPFEMLSLTGYWSKTNGTNKIFKRIRPSVFKTNASVVKLKVPIALGDIWVPFTTKVANKWLRRKSPSVILKPFAFPNPTIGLEDGSDLYNPSPPRNMY